MGSAQLSWNDIRRICSRIRAPGLWLAAIRSSSLRPTTDAKETLQLPRRDDLRDADVVKFLEGFLECPLLMDVTLEWRLSRGTSLNLVINGLSSSDGVFKELDHTLLRFLRPRIVLHLDFSLPSNSTSFWTHELRKCLPMLSQHGTVLLHSHKEGRAYHIIIILELCD